MKKKKALVDRIAVSSSQSFLMTVTGILVGYFWATFYPSAPFEILAWSLAGLSTGYSFKRFADKKYKKENDDGCEDEPENDFPLR